MLPYRVIRRLPLPVPSSRLIAAVLSVLGGAACGSNPVVPTPSALALSCPASQTLSSPSGVAITATYVLPVAAGGSAPVTSACTPPSGANFSIGTTIVTCSAADAKQQTASCSFTVTVTPPPRISVTRYVSMGDSITEGFPHTLLPRLVDPAPVDSYPAVLQALLRARYTAQLIDVLDEGIGGENVAHGLARFPPVLNLDLPGAVLLLEGANDLNESGLPGIDLAISGLRQMVRIARGRSLPVFVGTLLPERADGTPTRAFHPELVVPLNDAIRAMATTEGAILVDLYQAFGGVPDPALISSDGLHPTAAGNARIAQTFYDSIRARLEIAGTAARTTFGW